MNTMALSSMYPSPTNPRKSFDPKKLEELAESIKSYGVLQPILIRKDAKKPERFEVVCGERRYRAAKQAGLDEIPVTLRELSDLDVLQIQVIENLQRDDLHPMEEADGYEQLIKQHQVSVVDIAQKVGKSAAYVYQRLKLCSLQAAIRTQFLAGEISLAIAFLIARLPMSVQATAVKEVTDRRAWGGEPMSTAQVKEHLAEHYMLELKKAPFDIKIVDYHIGTTLQPIGGGACGPCPKRTGNQPELFDDVKSGDVCTDPICFKAKAAAARERKIKAAIAQGRQVIKKAEAKKLMPHSYDADRLNGGWLNLDTKFWEGGKQRTYRAVIGKECPPTTLMENPHEDELVELVKAADIAHLLKKSGAELPSGVRKKSKKELDQEERDRVKTARDAELRLAIFSATKGNSLGEGDLRMVAQLCSQLRTEEAKALAAMHGWTTKDGKPISSWEVRKHFAKSDASDVLRSLILVNSDILSEQLFQNFDDEDSGLVGDEESPDVLAAMASAAKIDAKAIEDRLLAEARFKREKREANAKAKAAKEKKAIKAKAKKP